MDESWPYRKELVEFADALAKREKRQLWRDDSLSKAERMLFVGFFFVRKLIECNKVSDRCARSSTSISRGAIRRTREVSAFRRDDLFHDLSRVQWQDGKVDVHQLADKIIHAWWITPISSDSAGLAGHVFTTDTQRNKELWFLPTASVIDVFNRFGHGAVTKVSAQRTENGRLVYWRAE
ncbi:hypothetical protein [Methylibium rhizosphaerae]|uniref:hypothetical protein n=1 Tax=Methylibium rhizosphaerae TaxID=2570323 RepID=UPI00112975EE|nr:hypothetical protein [Methylibium rhizosphaerae]